MSINWMDTLAFVMFALFGIVGIAGIITLVVVALKWVVEQDTGEDANKVHKYLEAIKNDTGKLDKLDGMGSNIGKIMRHLGVKEEQKDDGTEQ